MKNKLSVSPVRQRTILAIVSVIAGAFFWLSSGKSRPIHVPAYSVLRVIDGDTFETAEHQMIRLASTEAPEIGRCGFEEATKELEKLVLNKPVYLKVTFRDPYQRLVGLVYADGKFVNEEMLATGFAYYNRGTIAGATEDLLKAGDVAREKKLGLFSPSCTQVRNSKNPSCAIKGNDRNGKIYYTPDCGVYNNVTVQLYLGDQWFCTEKEAIKAGFRRPEQCQ